MCMSRSLPSLILVTKNQLAAGWLTGLLTLPSKQRKCDHICRRTGHRRILPRCNGDSLITRYNFTLVQIRPSGNTPPYHRNRVWPRCSCCSIRKKKHPEIFWHFRVFANVDENLRIHLSYPQYSRFYTDSCLKVAPMNFSGEAVSLWPRESDVLSLFCEYLEMCLDLVVRWHDITSRHDAWSHACFQEHFYFRCHCNILQKTQTIAAICTL